MFARKGNPTRLVGRQSTARHDTMDIQMVMEVLAPGMQQCDEADLRIQMSWVGGKLVQHLGDDAKQDRIEGRLVLEGYCCDILRHGEHHVEITDRQKIGLPCGDPITARLSLALRAMPCRAK
jgi:hypothetical protein